MGLLSSVLKRVSRCDFSSDQAAVDLLEVRALSVLNPPRAVALSSSLDWIGIMFTAVFCAVYHCSASWMCMRSVW